MKIFNYQKDTISLFKFIKHHTPKRIFSNRWSRMCFDYQDFHILAVINIFTSASQNKGDEVILIEFEQINTSFEPGKDDRAIFQNREIERLWILQTVLYFTDDVAYEGETKTLKNAEAEIEPNRILADLISSSSSGHEEIICHPDSTEAKNVNREFANLVEAGIMLEIDRQLLMCFSICNGFTIVGDIMTLDVIKEDVAPYYKFIEL